MSTHVLNALHCSQVLSNLEEFLKHAKICYCRRHNLHPNQYLQKYSNLKKDHIFVSVNEKCDNIIKTSRYIYANHQKKVYK